MEREIKIEGVINTDKYNKEEVTDMFIEWCESHGMYFGGGLNDITEEE